MTVNKNKSREQALSADEYEMLGREMEHVILYGYKNKKRLMFFSFLRGLITGAGSALGASLVIVLLLWVLSGLERMPLIGDVFENARQSIEATPVK